MKYYSQSISSCKMKLNYLQRKYNKSTVISTALPSYGYFLCILAHLKSWSISEEGGKKVMNQWRSLPTKIVAFKEFHPIVALINMSFQYSADAKPILSSTTKVTIAHFFASLDRRAKVLRGRIPKMWIIDISKIRKDTFLSKVLIRYYFNFHFCHFTII